MKKTKLKIEYDYDFQLLGIVSAVREYKLAWEINNALAIKLEKGKDILIDKVDHNDLVISNLLYETEHTTIHLLGNRSVGLKSGAQASLLPELQNFSHFMLVVDEAENYNLENMMARLKPLKSIEYIVRIEPDKLKNKDNLIF